MSDMYAIKGSTLTAMADAVRNKVYGASDLIEHYNKYLDINNGQYGNISLPISAKYSTYNKFIFDVSNVGNTYDSPSYMVVLKDGSGGARLHYYANTDEYDTHFEIETDTDTIYIVLYNGYLTLDMTIIPLDENGNEIKYTPLEMVDKINGLNVFPEEALTITGDCEYRFYNGNYDWFIKNGGDKITTKDITNAEYMFQNSKVEEIPFDINMKSGIEINMDYLFTGMENLKTVPKVLNAKPQTITSLFDGCNKLKEIPEDWCDTWDWSYMKNLTNSTYGKANSLFYGCYSLRKVPHCLFQGLNPASRYSNSIYYYSFGYCSVLDEIVNLPMPYNTSWTSNAFNSFGSSCYRLKNITFALQEDGTPYVMNWKKQTIDLTQNTGYANVKSNIIDRTDITADKEVIDDATYQALKDNPDWFTCNINYSRYNHDSAVNTINSLPDCSATGTNTIKFSGASGALTDGGAINTLTEEEIAVAVSRGWTVSLV